jgi:hypothetical protein
MWNMDSDAGLIADHMQDCNSQLHCYSGVFDYKGV